MSFGDHFKRQDRVFRERTSRLVHNRRIGSMGRLSLHEGAGGLGELSRGIGADYEATVRQILTAQLPLGAEGDAT
jgi:hypothetical protein